MAARFGVVFFVVVACAGRVEAGLMPGPDDIPLNTTAGMALLLNATHAKTFFQMVPHHDTQV